jgi:LPPG:FO 2-phospho-L-lactate transferase
MYVLAGLDDPQRGWGRRDESWTFMAALAALGGETWFQLGDGDLATHANERDGVQAARRSPPSPPTSAAAWELSRASCR